jgi:hypothetical protein
MGAATIINLDTSAPVITLGEIFVTDSMTLVVPYTSDEDCVIDTKLITTYGDVFGNVYEDQLRFDISERGVTVIQMLIIEATDDVLNTTEITVPLHLSDTSVLLKLSLSKKPTIRIKKEII